jgi:hypothetical protein
MAIVHFTAMYDDSDDDLEPRPSLPPRLAHDLIEPPLPFQAFQVKSFPKEVRPALRNVLQDLEFVQAGNRREQILAACKSLRPRGCRRRFSYAEIGRFFGRLSGSIISAQYKAGSSPRKASGRPKLLSDETEQWLIEMIYTRFREQKPVTYTELLDAFQYDRSVVISADYLRHFIAGLATVRTVTGMPMQSERVAVDPARLATWYNDLAVTI